jgi:acylphosphatase
LLPLSLAKTRCSDNDRSFTQSKAQSYGLTGFVENKPNDKVGQTIRLELGPETMTKIDVGILTRSRWKEKLRVRKMLCRSSSRTSTADRGQLTS